jgi:phenylacetate-CoA ligase
MGIIMEKYWNKPIETMEREQIGLLQLKGLRAAVENVYANVPCYREKMQAQGIIPGDIKSLDNLRSLPFTTKQDFRDTYPFGLFAAPAEDIIRVHASSGTTGKQTVVGYTRRDIDIWAECMARCLVMADVDKHSRVQVSYGYGLFTGGHGTHYGAEKLGAMVIPASSGNTQRQITMMIDLGVTHLCCSPSYAMYISEVLGEMGYSKEDLQLQAGCFGSEAWSSHMRLEIERRLGLRALDIYGIAEIVGPSVSQECRYQNGLHIWEDCYIPEIINPDTGRPVPEGEAGELVISTISKEGMPILRYKTRDICSLSYEKCACGRTHARMSTLAGRTDDMLTIRGVNVFPSQIEAVLLSSGEVLPHYQLIIDRVNHLDTLTVEIEMSDKIISDNIKDIEKYEQSISKQVENVLSIKAKIRLVEPKRIARSEGKAIRIIDKRKLN